MALPQAIDIRISMLRLAPQCFAFTSIYTSHAHVHRITCINQCKSIRTHKKWRWLRLAPHVRVVQRVRLYIYIYIYISYVLGHGANLYRVQNGQDGRPLRSHCVRLKYSPRIASNGKEIV